MKNNKDTLMSIASSTSHKDISNLNVNIIDDLNMDSLDELAFYLKLRMNLILRYLKRILIS